MDMFDEQMKIIKNQGYEFYDPNNFLNEFNKVKKDKKILITIDDGFKSFYNEAWPYLKKNQIPFILFVSTEPVGKRGYMTWKQIKEVESYDFAFIGHHSHTHEYLIDVSNEEFILDIEKANKIFLKELGYIPSLFSYPFGEYSKFMKNYISKNFKYAFGQHSGVIDETKDLFELPRFPINEKYGELKRFETLIKTLPFKYKYIKPDEKYLTKTKNPPNVEVKFYDGIENLNQINCYSNEGNEWRNSKISFKNEATIKINLEDKFVGERGRINCSLKEKNGFWRWLGIQFVLSDG